MERHKDVVVSYGTDGINYNFAWVCTGCSAASPIAVDVSGFFGKTEPMYKPLEGECVTNSMLQGWARRCGA